MELNNPDSYRYFVGGHKIYACNKCATLTIDPNMHDEFHATLQPAQDEEPEINISGKYPNELYERVKKAISEGVISKAEAEKLVKPPGAWFVYGWDCHAYPTALFSTEEKA